MGKRLFFQADLAGLGSIGLRNGYVNCHYFSNFHVNFKKVSCPMSNLRIDLCHVNNIFSHVDRFHVTCRF